MGVFRLTKYFMKHRAARRQVRLAELSQKTLQQTGKKATLLCDFMSIEPHVLQGSDIRLIIQQKQSPHSLLYGGNYHLYAKEFAGLVKALKHLGVEVIFFVDGPPGIDTTELDAKFCTLKKRYYERLQRTLDIQQTCEGTGVVHKTWHGNPIITTQIIMSLRLAGVQVVICLGEADPEIAEYARSHEEVIGILSADSDFAVMSNCTLFPWCFFDCEDDDGDHSPDDIVCQVVSPATLAEALEIREDQIPELAVLCGNDYTRDLNRQLAVFSELGIEDSKCDAVEAVAKWLRGQNLPLLDCELVSSFCLKHPEYRDAVEHSYHMYSANYSRSDEPDSKPASSFFPTMKQEVLAGHMMRSLLSAAKSGIVWLYNPHESITLGQPCVLDMLRPLRKAMYILLGLISVKEFGRTYNKAFDEVLVQVNQELPQIGANALSELRKMSQNSKLWSFFKVMVNCHNMGLQRLGMLPRQVAQADLPDSLSSHGTFTCACLQLMAVLNNTSQPSINLSQTELDALLVTCLTCSAGISPHRTSVLPTMRAITLKEWFQYVTLNAYNLATLLGLHINDLPEPRNVFYGMAFIPYYTVATRKCHSHNELTAVRKTMRTTLSLESVWALKAAIFTEDGPCCLPTLLTLFKAAIEDIMKLNFHPNGDDSEGLNLGSDSHREEEISATILSSTSSDSSGSDNETEKMFQPKLMPSLGRNMTLPVMAHCQRSLQLIDTHRVVCIVGETGSGKSSQIPQFILNASYAHRKKCQVLVSQPNAIAAIKLAERVADERKEELGLTVGYRTEDESVVSPGCQLIYMTTGILLKNLIENKDNQQCTHVIIDEVHERSVDNDFVMLIARKLAQNYPKLKVVLMSATMQSKLFVKYFREVFGPDQVATPYFVGQKCFPIDVYYLDDLPTLANLAMEQGGHLPEEQLKAAENLNSLINNLGSSPELVTRRTNNPTISRFSQDVCTEVIISQARPGEGIIVFLPGFRAIIDYHEKLIAALNQRRIDDNFSVFVLHSNVRNEEQRQAFRPPPHGKAHVLITSRVSESSITIPKLKVVINFGITRKLEYDSIKHISSLLNRWSSHCSCTQRQGRVGRDSPGIAVHLITKEFHDTVLPPFDTPEIITDSLAKAVLKAKQIGKQFSIPKPSDFLSLAIEPPNLLQMEAAIQDLVNFGGLSYNPDLGVSEDAEITSFGLFGLSLSLDLTLCRLIYFGIFFECPIDAIVMATALSMRTDVFSMPTRLVMKDLYNYCRSLKGSINSRHEFDEHLYSYPIMMRNLFIKWLEFRSQPNHRLAKRHEIAHQFADVHVFAVRPDRLFEFESLVHEYAYSILRHFPLSGTTRKELQLLVDVVERGAIANPCFTKPGDSSKYKPPIPVSQITFCGDADILKTLFIAAYPSHIICGEHQLESSKCKEALEAITDVQFDLSRTLVMSLKIDIDEETDSPRHSSDECSDNDSDDTASDDSSFIEGIEVNTPSETETKKKEEALHKLMKTLLPNHSCQTKIVEDLALVELGIFQRSTFSPGLRNSGKKQYQNKPGPQARVQDDFLGVSTPPEEVVFLWQFGERRDPWEVKDIDFKFTSSGHPYALAWHRLSQNREDVNTEYMNWRNPTAFVLKSESSNEPVFAIASTLIGTSSENYLLAKHLTVLPQTPATIMLLLVFQPLFTKVELLIDKVREEVVAVSINSRQINVHSQLTSEDVRQINSLREALSGAVHSSTRANQLNLPRALPIPQILQKILRQRPTTAAGGAVKPALDESVIQKSSFVWETVTPAESDLANIPKHDHIHDFQNYPPFQCTVLGSTPYASREEVTRPPAQLCQHPETSPPVTDKTVKPHMTDAENDILNCSKKAQVSGVPREVASAAENLTIVETLQDSETSLVEFFKSYLEQNDGEASLADIQGAFQSYIEEHTPPTKLKQLDSYGEFFKSHSEEFVICEGVPMTTVRLKILPISTSHSSLTCDTKDLQLQLHSTGDLHHRSGDASRMKALQDTLSFQQDSTYRLTPPAMAAPCVDSPPTTSMKILGETMTKLTVTEKFDSCLPTVGHEGAVQCGEFSGLSEAGLGTEKFDSCLPTVSLEGADGFSGLSEARPGSVAHTIEYFKQYLSTHQEGCSIHDLVEVHEFKYKQEYTWPKAPELPSINGGFFRDHPEIFIVTKWKAVKLKTRSTNLEVTTHTANKPHSQGEEHHWHKIYEPKETAQHNVQTTKVATKQPERFPPSLEATASPQGPGEVKVTPVAHSTAGQTQSTHTPGFKKKKRKKKSKVF